MRPHCENPINNIPPLSVAVLIFACTNGLVALVCLGMSSFLGHVWKEGMLTVCQGTASKSQSSLRTQPNP